MKNINELYTEAQKISDEIRRLQAFAESWPHKEEACALLRQRDELQIAFSLCMKNILEAETRKTSRKRFNEK